MDAALTVGALASFILLIITWVSLPQGSEQPHVSTRVSPSAARATTEVAPAHA